MAHITADRVKETTTTTGTGTLNLDGAATGFRDFDSVMATADTCFYAIFGGTEWEIGLGTFTAGTPDTLARTTILSSSNAGAVVNLSAGSKDVFMTLPATLVGPNAYLQILQNTYTTNTNLTTTIPYDDTTPTSTEGTQVLSQTITPADNTNKIECQVSIWGTPNSPEQLIVALFRGTTCICVQTITASDGTNAIEVNLAFTYLDSPATTSSTTYSVRVGCPTATLRLNGTAAARRFGGTSACTLIVREVASL